MAEMQKCGRCGVEKPVDEFAWRRRERGQRHNYCRPCHKAYRREHYLANRERYIRMANERSRQVREERTRFLLAYFTEHPCTDCGESDPVVLDFDHVGPKRFNIAKGIGDRSWQSVLDEIANCEVVCANCTA